MRDMLTGADIKSLSLNLTIMEARQLRDYVDGLLEDNSPGNHAHINDASYDHELTVALYVDERKISKKFIQFERDVMLDIIAEDEELKEWLSPQYKSIQVMGREFTGHGFFTHFSVSPNAKPIPGEPNLQLGAKSANVKDLEHGAGFILFVVDGKIDLLDGYAYGGPWLDPNAIEDWSLFIPPPPTVSRQRREPIEEPILRFEDEHEG
ncbi:MAG: hypothetical protein FWG78_00210 [Coriobacteriia bacterium]|nr:hypothetical protein [Coriobacteriia bacterium]